MTLAEIIVGTAALLFIVLVRRIILVDEKMKGD